MLVELLCLLYSATGGRWAVMATDFLQGLILVPLTLIVAWLCLDEIGGINNLFQEITAHGLEPKNIAWSILPRFLAVLTLGAGSAQ